MRVVSLTVACVLASTALAADRRVEQSTALLRSVREIQALASVPPGQMTAHAMVEDRDRCVRTGMDGYVSKPIDAATLFDAIAGAVAARAPAPGGSSRVDRSGRDSA